MEAWSWHAEYLNAAAICRRAGRISDARRWLGRASGLRLYLTAAGK